MRAYSLARSKCWLVAVALLGLSMVSNASQAEMKMSEGTTVHRNEFKLDPKSLPKSKAQVPLDGWPQFSHGDLKLKVAAPAPALVLTADQWKRWRSDLVRFKFEKLRDRQVMYAYYLPPSNTKKVDEILDAVMKAATAGNENKQEQRWTAIGVEYDTKSMNFPVGSNLYSKVAVPMKWTDASYKFIKAKHDPKTFAALVSATTGALKRGAFANFVSVENWSGYKELPEQKMTKLVSKELSPKAVYAYLKGVSKGPLTWQELKPVASFIAVDRKLDIEGVEVKPILTSKMAWWASGE